MINNLYHIGSSALSNAQVSVNNASNNIANADTPGYQRTEPVYETGDSITVNGLTVGTGANIESIEAQINVFVEAQYLDAAADLARYNASLEYLSQLDSLFNQTDTGLGDTQDAFWTAWNDLSTDPDSSATRQALLGESQNLVYAYNSTAEQLDNMEDAINAEIKSEIDEANQLIADIATANAGIAANADDLQLVSDRDQMIRELDAIIGVTSYQRENGQMVIMTEEGQTLVDGTQTHMLAYGTAQASESLMRGSAYDGQLQNSGSSSEEILLEFVSAGPDGSAQFKVSLDGGNTWQEDESGNTMLYTAGDEDESVTIAGVEIWFDGGAADHAVGDRYNLIPKSGLYWEQNDGTLVNITPLTDASGQDVSGRTSGGSLAGLFSVRDDAVVPGANGLDELAEALIWEVNQEHSSGAGTTHHTVLTGSYAAEDPAAALANSGLHYADNIQPGEIELVTYDADGNVSTSALINIDPATDSLDDVVADLNAAFGGELTASVDAQGQLQIVAATGMEFEIAGDSSNLLAAAGINTFFTGTDAQTLAVDEYVAGDITHINAGAVSDDGTVASGSNTQATSIAALSAATASVGGQDATLGSFLAELVSSVGAAAHAAEMNQTYAQASAQFYYDQQASTSEVNLDEELIALTRYQQSYEAASKIITVTRDMMDTLLAML